MNIKLVCNIRCGGNLWRKITITTLLCFISNSFLIIISGSIWSLYACNSVFGRNIKTTYHNNKLDDLEMCVCVCVVVIFLFLPYLQLLRLFYIFSLPNNKRTLYSLERSNKEYQIVEEKKILKKYNTKLLCYKYVVS